MWKWQLVLSALATFTTAFAAPMPSVTIDMQKVDETIEPVPRIARFDYEAKDGLLLRNGKPFFWTSDGASLGGVHSTPLGPFCSVTDLLNGETVAEDADRFTCRFAAPDTRLFDIQR